MGTPLKIKISKIGLYHVLSWPKLGLEPKFHDPGTFGGFGKREQTHTHTRFMFYKYRFFIPTNIDVYIFCYLESNDWSPQNEQFYEDRTGKREDNISTITKQKVAFGLLETEKEIKT